MCCYKYFSHCLMSELELEMHHSLGTKYIWSCSQIPYSLGIRLALSILKLAHPTFLARHGIVIRPLVMLWRDRERESIHGWCVTCDCGTPSMNTVLVALL